jgi:hypothetical protein
LADQSKNKWFPWRRLLRSTQTPRPETREVAVSQVTDKYSEYPSDGLTPVRLAEIFKEADAGDVLRQAELFEEMEEKDPHLFSQLQTRKNAVTGLDYEVIPFDSDDPRDKEIAEFVEAQIGGIEGFEDVMLDLLDAIGKGFAVSEIMWSYDEGHVVVGDIRSRHQKRFFWDTVDDSFKVRTQDAPEGILLPKNKFIVHKYKARSGHPSRAGVLRVVSWMEAKRKKVKNYDIQVVTAWGRLVKLDGSTQITNLAGLVCGLYAKAAVQESIGKTRTEAGFGIPKTKLLELLPAEMDNSIIELLDLAGYLTFREYDGLDDFYVYHTKMMSPDGSDFRYAEDVRVKNKIIRETRKEGLLLLNDDIDLEDVQGELETRAKFMFVPLQRMIDAKEISSAEITVPEGQAETILEDETMRVKIRYVSRGYIREVEVDLGRAQPSE